MITVMKTGAKRKLEIKTWEIKTDRLKRTDGSLRIVFLADLHDRLWGEGQEQLLEAIDSLKADLILWSRRYAGGKGACCEDGACAFAV